MSLMVLAGRAPTVASARIPRSAYTGLFFTIVFSRELEE